MKKNLVIIVIAIVIIVGGYLAWEMFIRDFIEETQHNNNRINNSKTLSQYIKYHEWGYTDYTDDYSMSLNFYAENIKCDILNEKNITYVYDDSWDNLFLLFDDYTIYETAFKSDKLYSNGQQYKQIDTDIKIKKVKVLFNKPYFITEDNKYYSFDVTTKKFKEIEKQNMGWYDFEKIATLLKDEHIVKAISNQSGKFVVLKNDGQVYLQEYNPESKNNKDYLVLSNDTLLLSNKEYGNIIDCEYSQYGENKVGITKVVSDKGLYYLKQTNDQQYIDTEATYEIVASDIYTKYKSDIRYIDTNYVFTTDNNIIKTDMLCRDIDKEVK